MNTSNAVVMSNRDYFQQREAAALRRIPGVRELLTASNEQKTDLERKYPEAVFALNIVSNPFVPNRELGAIRMEAYSAILSGDSISSIQYKFDRQMDAYMALHNWD